MTAQVNVVSHSMGGLITRWYGSDPNNKRLDNFKAGDVHKLITIDTPHLGSGEAPFLKKHQTDIVLLPGIVLDNPILQLIALKLGCFLSPCTLAKLMAGIGQSIESAIDSLDPDGKAIKLLWERPPFPYEGVAAITDGSFPGTTTIELALTGILKFFEIGASVDSLLSDRNDLAVSLASQREGASPYKLFNGPTHGTWTTFGGFINRTGVLDQLDVAQYVGCRLLNGTGCDKQANALSKLRPKARSVRFSLEGRTEVPGSNINLTGAPLTGLELNNDYTATLTSTTFTVEGFVYIAETGMKTALGEGDATLSIHLVPSNLDPVRVTILAALSGNNYAIRSWEFTVDPVVNPTLVDVPEDLVSLARIGATYQLDPVAYLEAPDLNTLDIRSLATYSILGTGSNFVKVSKTGIVTALQAGVAEVQATYKKKSDIVQVVVSP